MPTMAVIHIHYCVYELHPYGAVLKKLKTQTQPNANQRQAIQLKEDG
jgi:hypothetical protein